jgi:two-component system, chemotaxis family, chemotaxis protein CheY
MNDVETDAKTDVLVVDDDRNMREILELALGTLGYAVATAADGVEALEWLGGHPIPRVVLLDWMMPRCDGSEFRRRQLCDARFAKIPVVLLTADLRIDRKRAQLGISDCVQKPISLATLRELMLRYVSASRAS